MSHTNLAIIFIIIGLIVGVAVHSSIGVLLIIVGVVLLLAPMITSRAPR